MAPRSTSTTCSRCSGPFAVNGIPIIGVEPSCTAVLRGDLLELLPKDPRAHAVAANTYTLAEVLTGRAPVKPRDGWQVPRLDDVTAVVQPHCHQYSVTGFTADRDLLARAGVDGHRGGRLLRARGQLGLREGPLRRLRQGRGELAPSGAA